MGYVGKQPFTSIGNMSTVVQGSKNKCINVKKVNKVNKSAYMSIYVCLYSLMMISPLTGEVPNWLDSTRLTDNTLFKGISLKTTVTASSTTCEADTKGPSLVEWP